MVNCIFLAQKIQKLIVIQNKSFGSHKQCGSNNGYCRYDRIFIMTPNSSGINPREIAICMITKYPHWYPGEAKGLSNIDKVRGDLALQSIKLSIKKGYQTVVGYHTPSSEFNNALNEIMDVVRVKRDTGKSSPAKRQVIETASQMDRVKVIVLTEPEKVSFIKDGIAPTVKPILDAAADIVIPGREETLFKETYPRYMYESEKEGIALYNEELRSHGLIKRERDDFDMFFGPRALSNKAKVISLFLQEYRLEIENISLPKVYFDAEELSNTQFFPVVRALQRGLKVAQVKVPFRYPEKQRDQEIHQAKTVFIQKRRAQKLGLIVELLHFVSFLEKNTASRVESS